MGERAQALERSGVDVVHLEFGEPDFEAPAVVREAVEKAVKDGRTRYTHSLGILPLREAIAEHYAATYGVNVSPDQILVTAGTSPTRSTTGSPTRGATGRSSSSRTTRSS